jgi:hypothetical protein
MGLGPRADDYDESARKPTRKAVYGMEWRENVRYP